MDKLSWQADIGSQIQILVDRLTKHLPSISLAEECLSLVDRRLADLKASLYNLPHIPTSVIYVVWVIIIPRS